MPKRCKILAFAAFSFLVGGAQGQTGSQPTTYFLALYKYFSYIEALPIVNPQGEKAGDVYSELGRLYARKSLCFDELATDRSDTYLLNSVQISQSDLSASADVKRRQIGRAAGKAGVRISDEITLTFGEKGKASREQLLPIDIERVLNETPQINACRQRILDILKRDAATSASGVPLIIETVWYATVNVNLKTTGDLSADAKASLESDLGPANIAASIDTATGGSQTLLASPGDQPFPVAWRPAFISASHFDAMMRLRENSWFKWVAQSLRLEASDREVIDVLRKEFKVEVDKFIPSRERIRADMTVGPAILFDPSNENHLAYIATVGVAYGLRAAFDVQ